MSAKYYADMSDMRDAGGIADDEFVLSDDYAALKAERDALRERCEKLERVRRIVASIRFTETYRRFPLLAATDAEYAELGAALAATEAK